MTLPRLLAAAGFFAAGLTAANPEIARTVLFEREQGGFQIYRIPGVIVTGRGTVLAYAEARKSERSDWGEQRIVMRRSTDGGKTWSLARVIGEQPGAFPKNPAAIAQNVGASEGVTYNNAVMIPGRTPGVVHFIYCIEYMRAFYMRSDDDGVTFSKPREITSAFETFRTEYDWKVIATGPGHGIRLKNGRLLIPVWLSTSTGGHAHRPSVTSTIYSDDEGVTWKRGEIAVPNTDEYINPNETAAAQLDDGRVMLNVRSESKPNRRLVTYSRDGATNWTRPEFVSALLEPICFGSGAKLPGHRLLFVNPDNLDRADGTSAPGKGRDRKNETVQLSEDDGVTWKYKKVLEPGPSSYADIAAMPDGTIFCFYEKGAPVPKGYKSESIVMARFGVAWLQSKFGGSVVK